MPIINFLRHLKKKFSNYEPLVNVVVYRDRILHNLQAFRRALPHMQIAPVLKSNAYGHGLVAVAGILENEEVPFLVVDSPYEAMQLRGSGIKAHILVLGYTTASNIQNSGLKNVAYTITSLEHLESVLKIPAKKSLRLHLKIDTGMHRQGIQMAYIRHVLTLLEQAPNIIIEGVCSHLADPVDHMDFTMQQINNWHEALKILLPSLPNLRYKHLSASFGVLFANTIDANVIRLGIGLYGYVPDKLSSLELQPALELRTVITSIRGVRAGECVGYNCTFVASGVTRVATLPLGYFEGVDRRLSSAGCVTVDGIVCPIVGLVSMNITSIDVTNVPNIELNDYVTVINPQPDSPNSIANIAKICNTVPYEILVHIPWQLRRVVV